MDAGVATVLAGTVTEQSRLGLGGEIPILIKMKGKPVIAISGVGVAGSKATVDFFEHRAPEKWEQPGRVAPIPAIGPRAAITPGLVDGLLRRAREIRDAVLQSSGRARHRVRR